MEKQKKFSIIVSEYKKERFLQAFYAAGISVMYTKPHKEVKKATIIYVKIKPSEKERVMEISQAVEAFFKLEGAQKLIEKSKKDGQDIATKD